MWQRLFSDSAWLDGLFAYIRNILYCSLILAVGSYTHKSPPEFLRELPLAPYLGYPMIVGGIVLFLLNLAFGLNRIFKLKVHVFVKSLLVLAIVYLTSWLVMVIWFFRIR